jgi:peroxisomal 2,4-dienoyl-CoA reductase
LQKVADELVKQTKSFAKGYSLDLKKAKDADVDKLIKNILQDFGRIDVLVNGAAGNFLSKAEDLSLNAFKTVLEIDTIGTFLMSKHVYINWMKANGGSIINITSTLQNLGTVMLSHACAAKAGVDALTKTLALEWGPKGVRVNGVAPGYIEGTEGMDKLSDLSNANKDMAKTEVNTNTMEQAKSFTPLQRLGNRQDVSNTVLFLASDLSSYITGQTIVVDGGILGTVPNYMIHSPDFMKMWTSKY